MSGDPRRDARDEPRRPRRDERGPGAPKHRTPSAGKREVARPAPPLPDPSGSDTDALATSRVGAGPPPRGAQGLLVPFFTSVLTVAVALGLWYVRQGAAVHEVVSPDGAFSISMPGANPEPEERELETPVGRVVVHLYVSEVAPQGRAFTVSYTDYPEKVFAERKVDEVLDDAVEGTVARIKGRLVSKDNVLLEGYPGRELVAEIDEPRAVLRSRLYVVKRRLYQTIAIAPPEGAQAPEVRRYLDSFRIRSRGPASGAEDTKARSE